MQATPSLVKVPFLDLRVSNPLERQNYLKRIDAIFQHGFLVNGPEGEELESKLANYCGAKYAVGVGSGTDALIVALKALDIGPGDEVITTCLSFVATANAIAAVGAAPIFVDIKNDLLINPEAIASAITSKTKAIMPVHFTGKLCDMPALQSISEKYGIPLIEDAAPAFGATYLGQKAGSFGVMGCLSMNPMKLFGACGEAGVVLTNSEDLKEKLTIFRYNGMKKDKETCVGVSVNARLDGIQAAILLEKLLYIEDVIARRRQIAEAYSEALRDYVTVPTDTSGYRDVYYTYTIQSEERDDLSDFLEERGIQTKKYFRVLMPNQPAHRLNGEERVFACGTPVTKRVLCLPMHEKLSDGQVEYVIESVQQYFNT